MEKEEQPQQQKIVCSKPAHSSREAIVFCSKCDKFYCSDCEKMHNDLLGDHVESLQKVSSGNFFTEKCHDHPKYPLDLFCKTHWKQGGDAVCCLQCKEEKHASCDVVKIDELDIRKVRYDFVQSIEKFKEDVARICSLEDMVLSKQEAFDATINELREEITKVFNTIKSLVRAREEATLCSLEELYEKYTYTKYFGAQEDVSSSEEMIAKAEETEHTWDSTSTLVVLQKASHIKTEIDKVDARLAAEADSAADSFAQHDPIKFIYDKAIMDKLDTLGSIITIQAPANVKKECDYWQAVQVSWDPLTIENFAGTITYQAEAKKASDDEGGFKRIYEGKDPNCIINDMICKENYVFRVRACIDEDAAGVWCKSFAVACFKDDPENWSFVWKQCPNIRFCDEAHKIVERINIGYTTVIGTETIPPKSLINWRIKVVSTNDDDNGLMVGVAPNDIDTSKGKDNSEECGWYFSIYRRNLYSGPPQKKKSESYTAYDTIKAGDIITVTIDSRGAKGVLSFAVNDKSLGVAYNDIPLDKPLVPAAFLYKSEERIELLGSFNGVEVSSDFVWKQCPNIRFCDETHKTVERIDNVYTTAIGTSTLAKGAIHEWKLSVVKTDKGNNGTSVGVAPNDIDTSAGKNNRKECGWYLTFFETSLHSGPPQSYNGKAYGNRNDIEAGDIITITVDLRGVKGIMSFAINDEDLGVAYNDIPLDKPLVPAVFFYGNGEIVKLVESNIQEAAKVIVAPGPLRESNWSFVWKQCPNIRFCDEAHRIVERINIGYTTVIGTETIPPKSLNSWRIKVVSTNDDDNGLMVGVAPNDIDTSRGKDNSEECGWYFSIYGRNLYSGPPQKKNSAGYTACDKIKAGDIITVTIDSRGAKGVLSFAVNGKSLGVAYNDIPLDKPLVPAAFLYKSEERIEVLGTAKERSNFSNFTWVQCPNIRFCDETHKIVERINIGYTTVIGTETIPPKSLINWRIKVVSTNDDDNGLMVGVAPNDIDTSKGKDNSEECGWYFSIYGRNLYSGPPQKKKSGSYTACDKIKAGDIITVTIDSRGAKGVLSFAVNDKSLGVAYNDIPLDKPLVPAAFLYKSEERIELLDVNSKTKIDSALVFCWKKCPMLIRDSVKYVLTDETKKIARKTDVSSDIYCTIIGDTSIPKGKTVSWTIYCKSIFDSEGEEFFVGVAPASVDQKSTTARYNSGWYLCWGSGTLFSGPPHKYVNKHYCMPRGVYVGSTVGLIMSTKERTGTLSFVFNGTDEGFAYEGIPLDKPLVPAVLLHYAGDSVEIV